MKLSPEWKLMRLDTRNYKSTSLRSFTKAVLQSAAFRILVATGIAWIIVFNYFKHVLFWREPHSAFFNPETVYDFHYSTERLKTSDIFIDSADNDPNFSATLATDAPVLCASIGTVKRKINFLNGTVGTMIATLTDEERSAVDVRVSFLSTHADTHPDYDAAWLKTVDYYGAYQNVSEGEMQNLTKWEADMKYIQRKGVWDYVYLLNDCYSRSTAPYIAVFEDDIVFAEGWLAKTIDALADLRKETVEWLYLRLFYTETFHVFWQQKDFWHRHRVEAYALSAAVTGTLLFLLRACSWTAQRNVSVATILVIACVTVPLIFQLGFMVPKHSLKQIRPGLTRMDAACCTQALVFPRSQVPDVMDFLIEKGRGQTDLLIEKYANELGMARFAVEPQQVQHVGGMTSSRGPNSKGTIAYLFEEYNKDKLKKEHERLTRWDIWRAQGDGQG